jgi:hypothetical protein
LDSAGHRLGIAALVPSVAGEAALPGKPIDKLAAVGLASDFLAASAPAPMASRPAPALRRFRLDHR